MTKIYDAIIVGAGPAGSAAAISLAQRGYEVLVLEKSRFPRHKLCGEFVTPECAEVFERLNVAGEIEAAGGASIAEMAFLTSSGDSLVVPMQWMNGRREGALGLSRAKMDSILMLRARSAGATVIEQFRAKREMRVERSCVTLPGLDRDSEQQTFRGRVVIDASGRSVALSGGASRKALGKGRRRYALKAHLRGVEMNGRGELYFFDSGYGGLARIESGLANLCFITDEALIQKSEGDKQRLLDLTLRTNAAARDRLAGARVEGAWLATGPLEFGRQRRSRAGVIVIGDAAGMIDPFTGSGILVALRSGELAAHAVSSVLERWNFGCDEIAAEYERLSQGEFNLRYKISGLLRKAALSPFLHKTAAKLLARNIGLTAWLARATRRPGWKQL